MNKNKKLVMEDINLQDIFNNPWNSNVMSPENEKKLENSIKEGVMKPIVVRHKGNGTYEIIGGQHRASVLRKLGHETAQAIVHENMSDNDAKKAGLKDNARYGSDDGLKLSSLISSLDAPEELSELLPYSDLEVETLISSTNIDLDSLNLLDDDEEDAYKRQEEDSSEPNTHTVMRFKVAIEDSHTVRDMIDAVAKKNGYKESDSLTNAGDALVHILTRRKKESA